MHKCTLSLLLSPTPLPPSLPPSLPESCHREQRDEQAITLLEDEETVLVAAPQAVNLKKKIYRTKKIDGYFVGARMIEDNEQKKSGLPETLSNTIL